jgi:hypothetical protein
MKRLRVSMEKRRQSRDEKLRVGVDKRRQS